MIHSILHTETLHGDERHKLAMAVRWRHTAVHAEWAPAQVFGERLPLPDREDAGFGARIFHGCRDVTDGKHVVGAAGAL